MNTALLYPYTAIEDEIVGGTDDEADQILVPKDLWEQMMNTNENAPEVLLLRLHRVDTDKEVFVTVGGYHSETTAKSIFYCPIWVFHIFEQYSHAEYDIITNLPPVATKILIKPLDNSLYHTDIQEEISSTLSKWQSIKKGTIFSVNLEMLGGFPVDVFVEDLQPAEWCLLRNEAVLEMSEPLESVPEWNQQQQSQRPHTPHPEQIEEMIPLPISSSTAQKGYVPFGGKGYSLI